MTDPIEPLEGDSYPPINWGRATPALLVIFGLLVGLSYLITQNLRYSLVVVTVAFIAAFVVGVYTTWMARKLRRQRGARAESEGRHPNRPDQGGPKL